MDLCNMPEAVESECSHAKKSQQGRNSGRAQQEDNQDEVQIDVDFSILNPWHITAPQTQAEQEAGAFVPLRVSLNEESDWKIQSSSFRRRQTVWLRLQGLLQFIGNRCA